MADDLERRPNHSPSSPSRLPTEPIPQLFAETTFDDQPAQIWALRKQLGVEIRERIPNGIPHEKLVGRVTTEFLVVNSVNVRIISIRGASEARRVLYVSLFGLARRNGLNVFPSERMDEATRQWLTDTGLPDHSTPNT